MRNQKWNFLYALILTLVVFNLGIFMGYMLESSRLDTIDELSFKAEMMLLDQRIQNDAFEIIDLDCELIIKENIDFADKIFEDAMKISEYEKANRINNEIVIYHERYDLLRTLFWMNSIKIKEKCNPDYHNVVYFYKYNDPTLDQKSRQRFFSKLLWELKSRYGNNVMLIPIAADNDLPSIELLIKKYNIEELPSILIDEKTVLTEIGGFEEIEKYLD